MIEKLLTRNRMQSIQSAVNFEEAIRLASQPLLKEKVIEEEYIQAMIDSVYKNGPYIVLKDYFALPHAAAGESVHEVGMSLLILEDPVDLLGNPVKVFLVLAAVDSATHLEALAELSELLMEDTIYEVLLSGNLEDIEKVINKKE
jgi:PTS system ascorbate-specific IIA component